MRLCKRFIFSVLLCFSALCALAATYSGRVIDENGDGVPYATVYLENNPVIGTATNLNGSFTFSTDKPVSGNLIISFIGYEKLEIAASAFADGTGPAVRLHEQPIALEETVVTAKASRQKNKRKAMTQLLYKVYNRMQYDFPDITTRYRVVSDVRMDSENTPWGMEQMIATMVNIPRIGTDGRDSVQLRGEHCKRFFQQTIRTRADSILAGNRLNKDLRKAAMEVDSGVVVHRALWAIGNVRYDFEKTMSDVRHWTVSNESEKETVLTHVESKNYLGIFKYTYKRNYIVDSETYRIHRFSESLTMAVNIPFGYKFKKGDLELLNLLNMSDEQIEKFRLKKANATITLNTIYQQQTHVSKSGITSVILCPKEKNLKAKALLIGTKGKEIPIDVKATQRVTSVTLDAQRLSRSEMTRRMKREIVEIY